MTAPVRTRFAPSPTGELHLGNARTAVLNWLYARRHGGRFVLRFEDTDVERAVEGAEARILEGLDWLGLDRDEDPVRGGPHAPYRQSERLSRYREVAGALVEDGHAFRCYCTPEELEARRRASPETGGQLRYDGRCRELSPAREEAFRAEGREPAVRFRVDPGTVVFRDRVAGEVAIDGAEFGDSVILRADGRPTYNFAVVVDDVDMRISHVIRGVGHLSNTPLQVLLYRALDAPLPEFVHIPMVLAPGGGKLSKRTGAPGLLSYRDAGHHPDAVVNHLSLLSWSAPEGREVLGRDELLAAVELDRLGGQNSAVDPDKLRWLSGRHIRREDVPSLARRLRPWVEARGLELAERDLEALAALVRERIHLFPEAADEAERVFGEPRLDAPDVREAVAAPGAPEVLGAVADAWRHEWGDEEAIARGVDAAAERTGVRGAALYRPIRAALTGQLHGPSLPGVARTLGRERALERLERASRVAATAGPDGAASGAERSERERD